MTKKAKVITIITVVVVILLVGFVYFKFYFVFGEGVKSGELNYVVYKGYIFKTYEGKMIQSGFKGQAAGTIQSYEFVFSVEDKKIAEELMRNSGKSMDLHYKEYLGALPWRGVSKFVVDRIVSIEDNSNRGNMPYQ